MSFITGLLVFVCITRLSIFGLPDACKEARRSMMTVKCDSGNERFILFRASSGAWFGMIQHGVHQCKWEVVRWI